ncbi:MAG TPA: pentapeptide repeat-containing protein, partial [Terricaulis sp.]|nr:pentapeptide repeat-containing protein [Terricaulis sp.]
MLTQLRPALFALALAAGVWAGAASAQWRDTSVVRVEPGYGGGCEGCNLSGRILAGARMSRSVFTRADFSGAVLARADATRARFEGADFSGADLTSVKLIEARCVDANFSGADLTSAVARRGQFAR